MEEDLAMLAFWLLEKNKKSYTKEENKKTE